MGMGVVPLFTTDIDTTYYNPLIENEHYLIVESPKDIGEVIKNTDIEKWNRLSSNCLKWYEENASIKGSFDITMEIINKSLD